KLASRSATIPSELGRHAMPAGDMPPASFPMPKKPEGASRDPKEQGSPEDAEKAARLEKEARLRTEGKLHQFQTRLHLTPAQAAIAQAALQRAQDEKKEARASTAPGEKMSMAAVSRMFRADAAAAETVRASLNAEQQLELDKMQQEERVDRAEQYANQRMAKLDSVLKLSDEQKDSVHAIIGKQGYNYDPHSRPAGDPALTGNAMQEMAAAERAALAEVLDAEQLRVYDEFNAGQAPGSH
ncbi:MAG TPA: hypothetical protein VHM91_23725, partial [Verrucomicrobiales bacterium]|nr:hypothetical protein [Verrucomicrobiales bacterium]